MSHSLISKTIYQLKYARLLFDQGRRETVQEIFDRYEAQLITQCPNVADDITWAVGYARQGKVLASMRALQFAGPAMSANHIRGYNCFAHRIEDTRSIAETMYLSLCGTGVGWSVCDLSDFPAYKAPNEDKITHVIQDSIEGWADALQALLDSMLHKDHARRPSVEFDYSLIRPKNSRIVTAGGLAPGPEPLRDALETIRRMLADKCVDGVIPASDIVADILCHAVQAVMSAGTRRSAMIGLFSPGDHRMIRYKSGNWYKDNPQRRFVNVSALMPRTTNRDKFQGLWDYATGEGYGEPGVYWTNAEDPARSLLTNPCGEASVLDQFCNLTSVVMHGIDSQEEFLNRCEAAAILGTCQAAFTDFPYIRHRIREATERDALIGVSLAGYVACKHDVNLTQGAKLVVKTNQLVARKIGINPAARTTLAKPEGTGTLTVTDQFSALTSGIHNSWSDHYVKNVEIPNDTAVCRAFYEHAPDMIEQSQRDPHMSIIGFPMKSPEGVPTRHDTGAIDMARRVLEIQREWVQPGHVRGENPHSVSCTITVDPSEWKILGDFLYENRYDYSGVTVFPKFEGNYPQAPFQDITPEEFEELTEGMPGSEFLDNVSEVDDYVDVGSACDSDRCNLPVRR